MPKGRGATLKKKTFYTWIQGASVFDHAEWQKMVFIRMLGALKNKSQAYGKKADINTNRQQLLLTGPDGSLWWITQPGNGRNGVRKTVVSAVICVCHLHALTLSAILQEVHSDALSCRVYGIKRCGRVYGIKTSACDYGVLAS